MGDDLVPGTDDDGTARVAVAQHVAAQNLHVLQQQVMVQHDAAPRQVGVQRGVHEDGGQAGEQGVQAVGEEAAPGRAHDPHAPARLDLGAHLRLVTRQDLLRMRRGVVEGGAEYLLLRVRLSKPEVFRILPLPSESMNVDEHLLDLLICRPQERAGCRGRPRLFVHSNRWNAPFILPRRPASEGRFHGRQQPYVPGKNRYTILVLAGRRAPQGCNLPAERGEVRRLRRAPLCLQGVGMRRSTHAIPWTLHVTPGSHHLGKRRREPDRALV